MFGSTPLLRQALTPIALAIISFAAAMALWVAVTSEENPATDRELPFTIPVEPVGVPEGLAVLSMSPDSVVVTVRAPEDTFGRLTAANFRATVNMTGIRDTRSTQNIVVEMLGVSDDASVAAMSPRFTSVVLETEARKTVPVHVNRLGSLAQGYSIAGITTTPEEVSIVGPASAVALVESADVDVNLIGVRSNIQLEHDLTPRDGGGAIQPRVRVQPRSAEVRVTVQQLETPQIVPVLVQPSGQVAPGYNIVGISLDPRTVQVTGSLETLQTLDVIQAEAVDVSGASETFTRNVALQIPPGVQTERRTVAVTVEIEPALGSRAITVAPVVENVPAGMNAVIQTSSLTVRLSGEVPVLNELTPADIVATVDAQGLEQGVHVLQVQVNVPNNVVLDGVEPAEAVIALGP